jgi:hypothetical protein
LSSFAMSVTSSWNVNGTPSAVVVEVPKLERMSLRTIPLSVSTLTPLVPSPGYGPLVSSGISVMPPAAAVLVGDVLVEAPQAAAPATTAPRPSACSIRRRPSRVPRSKPSPWSVSSSWGRGSRRPS